MINLDYAYSALYKELTMRFFGYTVTKITKSDTPMRHICPGAGYNFSILNLETLNGALWCFKCDVCHKLWVEEDLRV